MIYVALDGYHQSDDGETTFMTGRQLEQVADQIDFGVQVGEVDMELARERLEKFQNQG